MDPVAGPHPQIGEAGVAEGAPGAAERLLVDVHEELVLVPRVDRPAPPAPEEREAQRAIADVVDQAVGQGVNEQAPARSQDAPRLEQRLGELLGSQVLDHFEQRDNVRDAGLDGQPARVCEQDFAVRGAVLR